MASENAAPLDMEALRRELREGNERQQLAAMDRLVKARRAGAPLVEDLAILLTSHDYVPCTAREYEFSGHAPISRHAAGTIECIGVAPSVETLRTQLDDHQVMMLPEASYDQGAYIGDYSSETIAPAGLAARLVQLMGTGGFVLLPELSANARHEATEIAQPAQRTIHLLADILAKAARADVAAFQAAMDEMAALPQAMAPNSWRGFELRDLAIHGHKRLAALKESGSTAQQG